MKKLATLERELQEAADRVVIAAESWASFWGTRSAAIQKDDALVDAVADMAEARLNLSSERRRLAEARKRRGKGAK